MIDLIIRILAAVLIMFAAATWFCYLDYKEIINEERRKTRNNKRNFVCK